MFANKFLKKTEFSSYQDYLENGTPIVPEKFNFAFDVTDEIAAETPDKTAIVWVSDTGDKKEISFGELRDMSNQIANVLTECGIRRSDTVMLFLGRRWEYWIIMIALHKIGAIAIPSISQQKAHDISYRIDIADIKNIIAFDDGQIMTEIKTAIGNRPIALMTNMDITEAMKSASKTFGRDENIDNSDTMLAYFTSGTTDMPKMVAHDFTYPLGHINTAVFWQRLDDSDIHFTLAETGWAKCSWGKMYGQWLAGAAVFVYDFSGKFAAENMLCAMSQNKVTSFCAPPTVYKMMLADNNEINLSALKKADVAGEALNPEVFRKFLNLTGVKIYDGFGQTETTVMLFTNKWIEPKPGSMGMPAAGWDIRLLDESGRQVPDGEVGEICVDLRLHRPVGLFKGYLKSDKLNSRAFRNGHYHTGDMAYRDGDGYYWFVGRNDDLIKSSGYRISPFEVESILLEHSAVREVAVTGVPCETRGMAVKATIVLNKYFHGTDALVSQIQEFVKQNTASYKYPRVIEFVEKLPLTISGKIKRAVIRKIDLEKIKKKIMG
ncbi:MAG: AMP-binding protein [Alphaproteobacteria bacterium]|nr:AMP-binding protein [Alphaproteobacteria bacterium]